MKMWSGGLAGGAKITNLLALSDFHANLDDILAHMGVESLSTVLVFDDHVVAVAAVPATLTRHNDGTRGGGKNRSTGRRCKINAVIAVESLRDIRDERPEIISFVVRAASAMKPRSGKGLGRARTALIYFRHRG